MKNTILFFSFLLTSSMFGQAIDSSGCTGAVGDVKYSVLSPINFAQENGNCWTFLDGSPLASNTKLHVYYNQWTHIPDARGYFIRSHDNRNTGRVDIDRTGSEEPGHIQQDEFKSHNHDFHYAMMSNGGNDSEGNGGDGLSDLLYSTNINGGTETRPVNMILYTYIRID